MYVITAQEDPYNVLRPFFPLFWLMTSQCWMNTIIYMVSKKSYRDTRVGLSLDQGQRELVLSRCCEH